MPAGEGSLRVLLVNWEQGSNSQALPQVLSILSPRLKKQEGRRKAALRASSQRQASSRERKRVGGCQIQLRPLLSRGQARKSWRRRRRRPSPGRGLSAGQPFGGLFLPSMEDCCSLLDQMTETQGQKCSQTPHSFICRAAQRQSSFNNFRFRQSAASPPASLPTFKTSQARREVAGWRLSLTSQSPWALSERRSTPTPPGYDAQLKERFPPPGNNLWEFRTLGCPAEIAPSLLQCSPPRQVLPAAPEALG